MIDDEDQIEFCPACETWNKRNPKKSVDPFHNLMERCPYLPPKKIYYSKIDSWITIKQIDKYLTDNQD